MFALIIYLGLRSESCATFTPVERDILCRDLITEGMNRLHVKGYAHMRHAQGVCEGLPVIRLVAALGICGTPFPDLPTIENVRQTLAAYLEQYKHVHVRHITAMYRPIQGLWEVGCLVEDLWEWYTAGK